MPKSCVKISQRDRKQRYKLYELIKHRDPKRRKGQMRESGRGEGLKIWHMTLIVVPCVRVHAMPWRCPLVPKHFFSFSVIAHIYGASEEAPGSGVVREDTRLGAFRFLLAALKGFQCFFSIYEIIDKRGATTSATRRSSRANPFCGSCIHS